MFLPDNCNQNNIFLNNKPKRIFWKYFLLHIIGRHIYNLKLNDDYFDDMHRKSFPHHHNLRRENN